MIAGLTTLLGIFSLWVGLTGRGSAMLDALMGKQIRFGSAADSSSSVVPPLQPGQGTAQPNDNPNAPTTA